MRLRSIIALLVAIILVAIGVILFRGGSGPRQPIPEPKQLPDYANTSASVRFTYDGIINGESAHRAIRITVNRNQRLLEVLQGYSGNVIQSSSEQNTEAAYNVFLHALANAGFSKTRKTSNRDVTGACPLGNRFIYELIDTGSNATDAMTWSTTCGGLGTFGGNRPNIQTLFQRQITDYDRQVAQVPING
jgi:hypothetical protein